MTQANRRCKYPCTISCSARVQYMTVIMTVYNQGLGNSRETIGQRRKQYSCVCITIEREDITTLNFTCWQSSGPGIAIQMSSTTNNNQTTEAWRGRPQDHNWGRSLDPDNMPGSSYRTTTCQHGTQWLQQKDTQQQTHQSRMRTSQA